MNDKNSELNESLNITINELKNKLNDCEALQNSLKSH